VEDVRLCDMISSCSSVGRSCQRCAKVGVSEAMLRGCEDCGNREGSAIVSFALIF